MTKILLTKKYKKNVVRFVPPLTNLSGSAHVCTKPISPNVILI